MSDFDVRITAIDSAMDAIEHYQHECSDLQAHISFDMRSLFERIDIEIVNCRSDVERLRSQINTLLLSMKSGFPGNIPEQSIAFELNDLYRELWQKEKILNDVERIMIHCKTYGTELLNQFLDVNTSNNLHADDAIRSMGRYIHDLNLICSQKTMNTGIYRASQGYYVCIVDSLLYPSTAEHILAAQNMGYPSTLTIDRNGIKQRREASLQDIPVRQEFDRDEYPMALFMQGGSGADIAHLERSDNRGAGAYVSWQLRSVPDGAEVRIRVI